MTRPPTPTSRRAAAEAFAKRRRALERFFTWEREHPLEPSAQASLSAVGLLYDLLPATARSRPVDTRGVRALHGALSALGTGD